MKNLEELQNDARKEIEKIIKNPVGQNEINYIASLFSILNYDEDKLTKSDLKVLLSDFKGSNANVQIRCEKCRMMDESSKKGDVLLEEENKTPIDMKIDEYDEFYNQYVKEKSLEETTMASEHGIYAEKALAKMLKADEEITLMLYNSADLKERQLIIDNCENTLSKIKEH